MKIIDNDEIKEITPEIIAEIFAGMSNHQQARFFNHIDNVASKWDMHLCFQLQSITDTDGIDTCWAQSNARNR